MIFLTAKRQKILVETVLNEIKFAGIMYEELALDPNDTQRIEQIQMGVEQALIFLFHRRPWWKFWNRPKKCKPIPCPPVERVDLRIEE